MGLLGLFIVTIVFGHKQKGHFFFFKHVGEKIRT